MVASLSSLRAMMLNIFGPLPLHFKHMLVTLRALTFSNAYARLRVNLAFALYIAIIVIGNIPGARAEAAQVANGFTLHSTAYAIITFLLFFGYRGPITARAGGAVLTIVVMGALDEYIQSYFPYRGASIADWLVDIGASVVMCFILILFETTRAR
jgi:VanZ family protein